MSRASLLGCIFVGGLTFAQCCGQQAESKSLPDAPAIALSAGDAESSSAVGGGMLNPSATASSPALAEDDPTNPKQTKRILGIIPNFRSVNADEKLPPMSVKEKFIEASQDNFDYSSVALPALLAVYNLKTNATPEFGHGGVGYGRYLWHSVLDQTSENYFVEFIVPVITHEDPRYYTLGKGGFAKRTWYSLTRVVVTRTDSDGREFNASEILGSGMSAGLSNLYYPSGARTFGNTASQWGLDVAIDAVSMMVKEFWPDINDRLFHSKQ